MKKLPILILAVILFGTLTLNPEFGYGQQRDNQETAVSVSEEDASGEDVTKVTSFGTFWELTEKGGPIRWFIFAVLFFGFIVAFIKIIELTIERFRSKNLKSAEFGGLTFRELKALVESQPDGYFKKLLFMMIKIFGTTQSAEGLREEIASFIQLKQDNFNTFKSRMAFLSDTAGALGLLGTVWGIFTTFFGGNVNNQLILSGMGIALITTLLGLIVSIFLNLCSTEIFSVFNKWMDLLANQSEAFRLRLMEIQQGSHRSQTVKDAVPDAVLSSGTEEESATPIIRDSAASMLQELRILDGNGQTGRIMNRLRKSLIVEICGVDGRNRKGIPVYFETETDSGLINGKYQKKEFKSDKDGRVSLNWTLGPRAGLQRVCVSSQGMQDIQFSAEAIPGPASQFQIIEGNNQIGQVRSELPDP